MNCLFQNYKKQPKKLSDIYERWLPKIVYYGLSFNECDEFLEEVEKIGYTFDFDFDAIPYNLRIIKNKPMAKIEKTQAFFEWLHEKIKTIHVVSNEEFENIIEKL